MRTISQYTITLFAILILWTSTLQAGTVLTMEETVRKGLEVNYRITSARHNLIGAEEGRKSARGRFGPTLTANYSYTRIDEDSTRSETFATTIADENQWRGNLNITQPLFTGFSILNSYQRAALARDVAEEELQQARLELILLIQDNFLELLKARQDVLSAEDSVTRLESQLKVSRSFFDVGLRPKLDVLQTEVELARARQELLVATNAVATQRARLNTLLNLPVSADVVYEGELEYIPFNRSYEQCLATAKQQRPDLAIADLSVDIARKEAGIAASPFYPQIRATFDYNRYGDDPGLQGSEIQDDDEWRAGALLSWELFSTGTTFYAHRQAQQNIDRIIAEKNILLEEVNFEIKRALLSVEEASERITVNRKALEEAREGYRISQARYEAQVGTFTDVLDAQARLTQSEALLTRALADYQTALARLYSAMGEITFSLSSS